MHWYSFYLGCKSPPICQIQQATPCPCLIWIWHRWIWHRWALPSPWNSFFSWLLGHHFFFLALFLLLRLFLLCPTSKLRILSCAFFSSFSLQPWQVISFRPKLYISSIYWILLNIYPQPWPLPWVWSCTSNSLLSTFTWMSNEPWRLVPPWSSPFQLMVPSSPDAQARTLRVILGSSLFLTPSVWSLSQICWLNLQNISGFPPPSYPHHLSLLNDSSLLLLYSLISIL